MFMHPMFNLYLDKVLLTQAREIAGFLRIGY